MSNKILEQLIEIEKIIDDMPAEELADLFNDFTENKSKNPQQYAKIEKMLLEDGNLTECQLCGKLKPIDEVLFMAGMDYQHYAATNVCKDCL